MTLNNLVGRGLEKADTDKGEISRYLAKIRRKLEDSKKSSISLDSRFDIAFEALLQIALAALRVNGYRTTTGAGHQQLAIQRYSSCRSRSASNRARSGRWMSTARSARSACTRRTSIRRKAK